MSNRIYLDVTVIEPQLKHPRIFEAYDNLDENEVLLLHNDHDPKPVYYQLLGEKGDSFSWEYVAKGPVVWEVEIKKKPADTKRETIGEMVAKDIRKAEVFKKRGIDFCCGGKKTIEEACKEQGVDVLPIQEELERLDNNNSSAEHDYRAWDMS